MTAVPVTELGLTPLTLEDVDLVFVLGADAQGAGGEASDNYKQALTGVTLTPAANTTTLRTLSPRGTFTNTGKPTWTVALAYQQDWDTPGSLSHYLFANQGKAATLYVVPRSGGPGFRLAIPALLSGPVGGAGEGTAAAASVTLGVNGKPKLLTAGEFAALFDVTE